MPRNPDTGETIWKLILEHGGSIWADQGADTMKFFLYDMMAYGQKLTHVGFELQTIEQNFTSLGSTKKVTVGFQTF